MSADTSQPPADIVLRYEKIGGTQKLTDGTNIYWTDELTGRVRWAATGWRNDGLGVASHGGSRSLEEAVEAAEVSRRSREELRNATP